jgi:hypothetical protein
MGANTYLRPEDRSDPAIGVVLINYSSDQDLTGYPIRGFYLTTAGTLKVDMLDGSTATFSGLLAGTVYPFSITKIYSSGSTGAAGYVLL